ncbi:hypothetical protein [Sphingomonas sp.]
MAVRTGLVLAAALAASACNSVAQEPADSNVTIRNLVGTDLAGPPRPDPIEGDLIPTPSDADSQYYLLRARTTPLGNVIASIRQERGERVAYVQAELNCEKQLFHVLGAGPTRGKAEAHGVYDGPLRPTEGMPLRQEMARFVCGAANKPFGGTA